MKTDNKKIICPNHDLHDPYCKIPQSFTLGCKKCKEEYKKYLKMKNIKK